MTQEPEKETGEVKETTPSPEGLEALKEEAEQLRSKLQATEQNLKSAQGVTKKQAQDFEDLRAQYEVAVSSRDTYQALIGLISQQTGRSEEDIETEVRTKKPDLIKQAHALVTEQEQRSQQRRYAEKVESYRQTVEQELGLKEGDEDYDSIQGLVLAGKWDKADKKIEVIKAKKTEAPKEPEQPKETEDERVEKRLKEELVKRGLLTPEGGEPSAPGGELTAEMVAKMSPDERFERRGEIDKVSLGLGREKVK